ncbi:MAG: PHP domain-containing protein [Chloroflexi bacterium]|nr:PHP domain-containing protein [Chloroflexota bacterium]
MSTLDLHLHSTVSDGRLSPSDLVRLAHDHGVRSMALTDHDSTDGVAEAASAGDSLGMRVLPGIELSTDLPGASIHVLGVFIDYQQAEFQHTVAQFRAARLTRAEQMVRALDRLGAPVSLQRVFEIAGDGSVGRPHVAQALLEAGHIQSIEEAFERFIGRDGPAYFEGFRMEPREAVELIHSVGGLAAWAHPNELDGRDWREFLPHLIAAGIDGVEAYYSKDYGPDVPRQLLEMCARYDLVPTVGSDYHGFAGMDNPPGCVSAPANLLERLEARLSALRRGACA